MGLDSNDRYLPKYYTLAPNCGRDFHQNPECEAGKIIKIFSKMMKKVFFFVELEFINNYL